MWAHKVRPAACIAIVTGIVVTTVWMAGRHAGSRQADRQAGQYMQEAYNASREFQRRREQMKSACLVYKDRFRAEHASLYGAAPPLNHFTFFGSPRKQFAMCNLLKCGSNSWHVFMKQLQAGIERGLAEQQERSRTKRSTMKVVKPPLVDGECWPACAKEAVNMIQVRHPLERLLSAYRYVFERTDTYRDNRMVVKSLRQMMGGEEEHVTMSWRQFVDLVVLRNVIREEQEEEGGKEADYTDTDVWVKSHWAPYWFYCGVCRPDLTPHYIFHMDHLAEDVGEFLRQEGMEEVAGDTYPHALRGTGGHSSGAAEEYFGQLDKSQVRQLYDMYKMDHLLFGFTPDKYLEWAH